MGDIHDKRKRRRIRKGIKGWRFWAVFVAVPVIVTLCSSLAVYELYIKKRLSGRQSLEKGLIYANINRHMDAIAEFKKELEKDPENVDAHYHLGNSYLNLKEYDKAASEFNTALRLNPDLHKAHLQLAVINFSEAVDQRKIGSNESLVLEKLLEAEDICRVIIGKAPDFAKAYALLGDIHFSQGLIDDAIIDYKHALNVDSSFKNGHFTLARLYTNKGELGLAEDQCNLILSEIEPDSYQIRLLLSAIYQEQGKHDEAVVTLKKILKDKPEDIAAHTRLGLLFLRMSRYDEAYDEAEHVFKLSPSAIPAAVYFIKGSVLLQRKDYVNAVSFLKESNLRSPEMVEPHYFLAIALAESGRMEEAKTEFKTTIGLAPGFIPAQLGLAKLLTKEGWYKETIDLCRKVLEIKHDSVEAMQILGMAYIGIQDFENAEEEFKKILEFEPLTAGIKMAYLSFVSGKLSKCIRQCEEIIKTDPSETAVYEILGVAHIRRGNLDSGIEQFEKAIEINPDSTSSLLNLAKAYVITGRNEEAKKTLDEIVSIDSKNLHARTISASLYERENNIDEAVRILEKVLEINPDYVQGYALADLYFLQGKTGRAIDLYNKALKLTPDNAVLQINLAISYQQIENYNASITYCRKAIELKPEIPAFRLITANIYAANGEYGKAKEQIGSISRIRDDQKKTYLELIDLCQQDNKKGRQITLALDKAIIARQRGLFELAVSECKKAMEIFPDNIVPKVILADTYLNANRNEDAIGVYSEIIKDKPEFTSFYYDLGKAYFLTDKQDEAISMYQNMLDIDSRSVPARLALAGMLIRNGSADAATKVIEEVIELDSGNLTAHGLLGEVSLSDGDYGKAETEFSRMIELGSDTFEGHFNMARMKFAQGDYDKCIEHCRTALQARPVDVHILNILGMAYMRKGMTDNAVAEFNKIIDINSDFIPAYLNLADIYIFAKRPDISAFLYNAALKIDPDSIDARLGLGNSYALMGRHTDSITELESIIKTDSNNVNAHISLAGSHLAVGDNSRAQEAAKNALNIDSRNQAARYLLAKIYERKGDVRQAINQLKTVLTEDTKFLDAYELGILYMDVGEYDNAVLTYRQGVENFPDNAYLWCNLAVAYQLRMDFKEAKEACDKALNIQTDEIMPNLCMVITYLGKGEFENAKRHLKGMIKANPTQKNNYLDLVEYCNRNQGLAGKVSYHLGRALSYTSNRWFGRVLKEYNEITKIAPANTLAYNLQADILIMTEDYDKAIEVCKKIIELEPRSPEIHNKLAGIYNSKGEKDEALAQFRKTISIDQNNVTAHLNLGILLESRDLLEESIDAYKKVIELQPASPVAYNNLAWLYASRMQDKLKEALKLAEKAKELTRDNPAIIDTLGWIYYLSGMYDKALLELRTAVHNASWNPTMRYHLGMVYHKKGLQREALTEAERALKINSTFPEAEEAKELIEKILMDRIKDTGEKLSMVR